MAHDHKIFPFGDDKIACTAVYAMDEVGMRALADEMVSFAAANPFDPADAIDRAMASDKANAFSPAGGVVRMKGFDPNHPVTKYHRFVVFPEIEDDGEVTPVVVMASLWRQMSCSGEEYFQLTLVTMSGRNGERVPAVRYGSFMCDLLFGGTEGVGLISTDADDGTKGPEHMAVFAKEVTQADRLSYPG